MNRPPESFVRVREDRLLVFATTCFEAVGLEPEHAALISRLLVNSDLRGVRSHGTRTLDSYTQSFEQGHLNPRPIPRVVHETPTAVVIDGDGTLGYLPMVQATEHAVAKARDVGIGMGLVRHIGHYGSAGHYARICMDAGCIGFSAQGYQGQGNAAGARTPPQVGYFGNPPICFAIPSGEEPPVVLDAATCILGDDQRGPEFDALLTLIPAAFFKSMGYTAVAHLLGGGLSGVFLPTSEPITKSQDAGIPARALASEPTAGGAGAKSASEASPPRWPSATLGGMVLAIHVDQVVPEGAFRGEVDRLVRDVRETYTPMPGTDQARLPGAIEEERLRAHRREGIRYGEMEQNAARKASERLGVPLPWD